MASSTPLRARLRTFLAMRCADRLLVCEAVAVLALARVVVLTVPFRYVVPWLRRVPETTHSCDEALVLRVGKAVTMAARSVPWNAVCLPQAMAARVMLARRGSGSYFHLGAGFDEQGKLVAHAWLVASGTVVVGKPGMSKVTPLARFG
jgi:hypothetical protein